jgi:UTP--glucose-1-phosphate uridylyltransferase
MKISRAVITAAGKNQRTLPIQVLIDSDGREKPLLQILVEEALSAGIEEVAVIVSSGDEGPYGKAAGEHRGHLTFIVQEPALGYGHAIWCAREFISGEPFLHLVGDHLYVSQAERSCASKLVETAETENCAVSSVRATREGLLPYYGAVGGRRIQGRKDLYEIETVIEKPAPTEAELRLMIPGLRAGHYLCFFGQHVLTPALMDILGEAATSVTPQGLASISEALAKLAQREKYLALEEQSWRYDVGVKFGLLNAQLALALNGKDRAEVLTQLLELLAQRDYGSAGRHE